MQPEFVCALIMKRWGDWQRVVKYQLPHQQEAERKNLSQLFMIYKKLKKRKNTEIQVNPLMKKMRMDDETTLIIGDGTLIVNGEPVEPENYFNYLRMDEETYNELFKMVEHKIKRQFLVKHPISAHARLQMTLRYLASGNSMTTISSDFLVASNTVSKVVTNTCEAIWDVMKNLVLPTPTTDMWRKKANLFNDQWDFSHCIGVIDIRQLFLQIPPANENDRIKVSDVLTFFAVVDAESCFSLINIGFESSRGGKIDFSKCKFMHNLENNCKIPSPSKVNENGPELPFVFVSDQDFPLTTNVLRSYPNHEDLELDKQLFNNKIRDIRTCADRAFRILTTQWKILHKKFCTSASNTIKIMKAISCLHNFLMMKDNAQPLQNKRYSLLSKPDKKLKINGCERISMISEFSNKEAEEVRDKFKDTFCENGVIILKWD